MNKLIFSRFKRVIPFALALMVSANLCQATSSTDLQPKGGASRVYQSRVNTSDCTAPIWSTPYVITAGWGGTFMDLTCPDHHPVMYNWQQELFFGGPLVVAWGGGHAKIRCCALKHEWYPTPEIS